MRSYDRMPLGGPTNAFRVFECTVRCCVLHGPAELQKRSTHARRVEASFIECLTSRCFAVESTSSLQVSGRRRSLCITNVLGEWQPAVGYLLLVVRLPEFSRIQIGHRRRHSIMPVGPEWQSIERLKIELILFDIVKFSSF